MSDHAHDFLPSTSASGNKYACSAVAIACPSLQIFQALSPCAIPKGPSNYPNLEHPRKFRIAAPSSDTLIPSYLAPSLGMAYS